MVSPAFNALMSYADGGSVTHTGRSDTIETNVPEGTYILPADLVSFLGEGATEAGQQLLEGAFGRGSTGGDGVPVRVSVGEYAVAPEVVEAFGGAGAFDALVDEVRRMAAQTAASRAAGTKMGAF